MRGCLTRHWCSFHIASHTFAWKNCFSDGLHLSFSTSPHNSSNSIRETQSWRAIVYADRLRSKYQTSILEMGRRPVISATAAHAEEAQELPTHTTSCSNAVISKSKGKNTLQNLLTESQPQGRHHLVGFARFVAGKIALHDLVLILTRIVP